MTAFFRLDGRTALVTGGGQGIGESICRRLAAAGARIAVFDRSAEAAARVAQELGGVANFPASGLQCFSFCCVHHYLSFVAVIGSASQIQRFLSRCYCILRYIVYCI